VSADDWRRPDLSLGFSAPDDFPAQWRLVPLGGGDGVLALLETRSECASTISKSQWTGAAG
jgi:hypothetical protein